MTYEKETQTEEEDSLFLIAEEDEFPTHKQAPISNNNKTPNKLLAKCIYYYCYYYYYYYYYNQLTDYW